MGPLIQNKQLAKRIAYMLGRCPGEFGLVTDPEGFVKTREFLKALNEEPGGKHAGQSLLNELLLTVPDTPFETAGDCIRARERLETADPEDPVKNPPPKYYTCIRRKALPHVIEKGISPSHHEKIVLSPTRELAEKIGKRRDDKPAVLTVLTEKAHHRGVIFFPADAPLVVADFIPPDCFIAPPLPKLKPAAGTPSSKPSPPKEKVVEHQAGSFAMKSKDKKPSAGKKAPFWKQDRKRTRKEKHRKWPDTT